VLGAFRLQIIASRLRLSCPWLQACHSVIVLIECVVHVVLKAGAKLSEGQINRYLDGMHTEYLDSQRQPHYHFAQKGLLIEEMLPADDTGLPMDYKFFVSDGRVLMVFIFAKRQSQEKGGTLSIASGPKSSYHHAWAFKPELLANLSHITRDQMLYSDGIAEDFRFEKPCGWEEMVRIAGCMSKGIPGGRKIDFD
jgi:hypothetical protein